MLSLVHHDSFVNINGYIGYSFDIIASKQLNELSHGRIRQHWAMYIQQIQKWCDRVLTWLGAGGLDLDIVAGDEPGLQHQIEHQHHGGPVTQVQQPAGPVLIVEGTVHQLSYKVRGHQHTVEHIRQPRPTTLKTNKLGQVLFIQVIVFLFLTYSNKGPSTI